MKAPPRLRAVRVPDHEHDAEADDAAGDERDLRRLVAAVRHGQEAREVAGARERVDLAAEGEDDGVEARDEAHDRDEREELREVGAEQGPEAFEQRLAAAPQAPRAGRDARVEREHGEGAQHQREDPEQDAGGHVLLRIDGLFGRERQLLDREVEPHREGQRGEHAVDAVREPGAAARGQLDQRAVRRRRPRSSPSARTRSGQRVQVEEGEAGERAQRHEHGDAERQLDAEQVGADEGGVAEDPVDGLELRARSRGSRRGTSR